MSNKLATALTVAIGGSSGAIGVAYLVGAFDTGIDYNLPKTLSDFKSTNKGIKGCVPSLFPGIKSMEEKENDPANIDKEKVGDNFFGTPKAEEKIEGCLVVNWDKEETENKDKGKGTFRFLWAAKQGNVGFLVFAAAANEKDTTDQKKKLNGEGVVYELKEEEKGGRGKRTKKLNLKENIKQAEGDLEAGFPKAGADDAFKDIKTSDFGGFLEKKDDINKACEEQECKSNLKASSFKGYGVLEEDKNKDLDSGTSAKLAGGEKWFDKDKGDMAKVIEGKKAKGVSKGFSKEPREKTK